LKLRKSYSKNVECVTGEVEPDADMGERGGLMSKRYKKCLRSMPEAPAAGVADPPAAAGPGFEAKAGESLLIQPWRIRAGRPSWAPRDIVRSIRLNSTSCVARDLQDITRHHASASSSSSAVVVVGPRRECQCKLFPPVESCLDWASASLTIASSSASV